MTPPPPAPPPPAPPPPGPTAALIVAAGRGQRFGGEVPKQYVPLAGPCALRRSLAAFLDHGGIGLVVVVIHPDDADLCRTALEGIGDPRLLPPVAGGASRAQSVRRGLEAMEAHAPARVLIHDAARPFVPAQVISAVIEALDGADGACAALPVVDALWRAEGGQAAAPVPRDGLWRAQTPQGFRFAAILAAHKASDGGAADGGAADGGAADGGAADDVAVARAFGLAVRLVEGSERNYKITLPADLDRALRDIAAGPA